MDMHQNLCLMQRQLVDCAMVLSISLMLNGTEVIRNETALIWRFPILSKTTLSQCDFLGNSGIFNRGQANLSWSMIAGFPLDYVHLFCLGVVQKLLVAQAALGNSQRHTFYKKFVWKMCSICGQVPLNFSHNTTSESMQIAVFNQSCAR